MHSGRLQVIGIPSSQRIKQPLETLNVCFINGFHLFSSSVGPVGQAAKTLAQAATLHHLDLHLQLFQAGKAVIEVKELRRVLRTAARVEVDRQTTQRRQHWRLRPKRAGKRQRGRGTAELGLQDHLLQAWQRGERRQRGQVVGSAERGAEVSEEYSKIHLLQNQAQLECRRIGGHRQRLQQLKRVRKNVVAHRADRLAGKEVAVQLKRAELRQDLGEQGRAEEDAESVHRRAADPQRQIILRVVSWDKGGEEEVEVEVLLVVVTAATLSARALDSSAMLFASWCLMISVRLVRPVRRGRQHRKRWSQKMTGTSSSSSSMKDASSASELTSRMRQQQQQLEQARKQANKHSPSLEDSPAKLAKKVVRAEEEAASLVLVGTGFGRQHLSLGFSELRLLNGRLLPKGGDGASHLLQTHFLLQYFVVKVVD
ncbi:hypothetical protein TYRP_006235 [Tyrophagus putrescentiae]|nr:hypothetical protein TYRP_006235 [Tyrophagus putrescentiae]